MVKLLILDVDGTLTDGTITYDSLGREVKSFSVKDGYGIVELLRRGVKVAVVSGRYSSLVEKRFRELGVSDIVQGVSDKLAVAKELAQKYGLSLSEVAAMGDDLPDLPLLKTVGISAAPADAAPQVKVVVNFVSRKEGGKGAVREFIDYLLNEHLNEA
jgi:3-deoxy-D-manno-octulosonate 8-phosphate phosphatase (KDO 8-P phosphatase)